MNLKVWSCLTKNTNKSTFIAETLDSSGLWTAKTTFNNNSKKAKAGTIIRSIIREFILIIK